MWALRCELDLNNSEDQTDEQPFDKGEMNVFLEEVSLTRLCCERICSIGMDCEISKFRLFKPSWILLDFNLSFKDTNTLDELIENMLQECLTLSLELSTCDLFHIYLCHLVDGISVKLYQRLLLIQGLLVNFLYINKQLLPNLLLLNQKLNTWKYPNSLFFSMKAILDIIMKLITDQHDEEVSILNKC